MRSRAKKKQTLSVRLTILLAVLAALFLALSVVSAVCSVKRTVDAIDAIGNVEFSDECRDRINLAKNYYDSLDSNLGLPGRVTNAEKLTEAKREYVRLSIKRAYLADKDGEDEETVRQYVADARQSYDELCSSGDCAVISNYEDLIALEEKLAFGAGTSEPSSPSDESEEEEIELC